MTYQSMTKHTELISSHSPTLLIKKSVLFFLLIRERSKDIDVSQINRDIYESEKAQSKANDDLEAASRDRDMTKDRLPDVNTDHISNSSLHFSFCQWV